MKRETRQAMDIDKTKELILVVVMTKGCARCSRELLGACSFHGKRPERAEALAMLKDKGYTFLLADMKMPEMNGMELYPQDTGDFPERQRHCHDRLRR